MGNTPKASVEDQFTADVTVQPLASRGGRKAPAMAATQYAIADIIHTLLHPKRQTGYRHKTHGLQPFVVQRLQDVSMFLHLYIHGTQEWTGSSLAAAKILG